MFLRSIFFAALIPLTGCASAHLQPAPELKNQSEAQTVIEPYLDDSGESESCELGQVYELPQVNPHERHFVVEEADFCSQRHTLGSLMNRMAEDRFYLADSVYLGTQEWTPDGSDSRLTDSATGQVLRHTFRKQNRN